MYRKINAICWLVAIGAFIVLLGYYSLDRAEKQALRADRRYWQIIARYPQISCRLMGGKYETTGMYIEFGAGEKENWQCITFDLDTPDGKVR